MNTPIASHILACYITLLLASVITVIFYRQGFFNNASDRLSNSSPTTSSLFSLFMIFISAGAIGVPIVSVLFFYFTRMAVPERTPQFIGWLNFMALSTSSFAVIIYSALQPLNEKKATWGRGSIKDFAIGFSAWLMSFAWVLLIGQIMKFIAFELGEEHQVEQKAVQYLKGVLNMPLLLILNVIAVVVIVPIAEEILFRGYLQRWMVSKIGRSMGIVLTAAIFSLFHFSASQGWNNIEISLSLFVLALFLGLLYELRGTLWAPIGLHMAFNLVSVCIIIFRVVA